MDIRCITVPIRTAQNGNPAELPAEVSERRSRTSYQRLISEVLAASARLHSALPAKLKERNTMAGYDTQQVGDATEISTTPEKVPAPWLLIAIPGGLLVLIALSISFLGGLVAAAFCYGAMYLLMHSKQA